MSNPITRWIQSFTKLLFENIYVLSQSSLKFPIRLLIFLTFLPFNFLQRNTQSIESIATAFNSLDIRTSRIDFIQEWSKELKSLEEQDIVKILLTLAETSNTWISVHISMRDQPRRFVSMIDLIPIKKQLLSVLELMQLISTYKSQLLKNKENIDKITFALQNNYINSNAYDITPDVEFYLQQFGNSRYQYFPLPEESFSLLDFQFLISAMTKQQILKYEVTGNVTPIKVPVKRDNVTGDLLKYILKITKNDIGNSKYKNELRKPIAIQFINEDGIDAGGLSSEFFSLWWNEILDKKYNLFTFNTESNLYWINKFPLLEEKDFKMYYIYIGIVIAYSLLNLVLVENKLPIMFWKILMGQKPNLNDIKELDPQLYQSLKYIQDCEDEDIIQSLELTFSVNESVMGTIQQYNLIESGNEINVNLYNKNDYVKSMIDYITDKSIHQQMTYIRQGFTTILSGISFSMFSVEEIIQCLCGEEYLDFNELKRVCRYEQPYTENSQIIKWFWEILFSFNQEQKKKFMKFTFASERAPAGGLKNINFEIRKNGDQDSRLPTTHTCFGILLLPEYSSKEILKEKLLNAIEYNEYFGLE